MQLTKWPANTTKKQGHVDGLCRYFITFWTWQQSMNGERERNIGGIKG